MALVSLLGSFAYFEHVSVHPLEMLSRGVFFRIILMVCETALFFHLFQFFSRGSFAVLDFSSHQLLPFF